MSLPDEYAEPESLRRGGVATAGSLPSSAWPRLQCPSRASNRWPGPAIDNSIAMRTPDLVGENSAIRELFTGMLIVFAESRNQCEPSVINDRISRDEAEAVWGEARSETLINVPD